MIPRQAPKTPLAQFCLASRRGNDRVAMERVANAVSGLGLSTARLERLKTAVAEATLNAMEHGNHFEADRAVRLMVVASAADVVVTVADSGGPRVGEAPEPDLRAKLAGQQASRGWGLFLIRHMVDEVKEDYTNGEHRLHLRMLLRD